VVERTSSANLTSNRPRTVLIVEDEQLMLRILNQVFSEHGFQVFAAADGEAAIEIYRSHKREIDIVLLDIGIPKVPGWNVFLKMREENPDVRVVIASGYLDDESKAKMTRAGIMGFVDKPYLLHELVETLKRLIDAPVPPSGSNTPVT
jgi:two-component system, cell cycle sensor histidine kinase and response regulator CckA